MDSHLGVISVASPCSQRWDAMAGNDRVRHCGRCDKNVYSLDTLTPEEVRQLVIRTEGRICWRFYVRKDGTVLTRDCPTGRRAARRRTLAAAAGACVVLLASTASALRQAGLWELSQALGSFSQRVARGFAPPEDLVSNDARGAHVMGLRFTPPKGNGR